MNKDLVTALDTFFPDTGNDPTWTESIWFSWAIPERDINGFFWVHFRPNQNMICGGPAMWDRAGELVWEFPYFDFQTMRPMPEGRWGIDYNKFDFTTPWGLSINVIDPLERYHFAYDRAGFQLDLTFTACAAPNVMGEPSPEQLAQAFRLHFEQPGRIEGHIVLNGEHMAVDCWGVRDAGHGPRYMENSPPGAYCWSTADAQNGFHVLAPNMANRTSKVIGGYILRDGVISHAVDGYRRVLEREGPRPEAVEIYARDELGRELHATGRRRASAKFMPFPERGVWWSQFRWDYENASDVPGEDQEFRGIHTFRDWHKAGPSVWERE